MLLIKGITVLLFHIYLQQFLIQPSLWFVIESQLLVSNWS